jgi:hypothetical protein
VQIAAGVVAQAAGLKLGAGASQRWNVGRLGKSEERFLSTQADAFAGAKAEEKIGLLRSE